MTELKFALTTKEIAIAASIARDYSGTLYVDDRADTSKLPFAAMVTFECDDLSLIQDQPLVGLHLVAQRTIKPGTAAVYGLYPLLHRPDKTHQACDHHWRDNHGPLALVQHAFMSHYMQLSVIHTFAGRHLDGIAMCGFANKEDLQDRFFSEPGGAEIIAEDIAKFADLKKSPRGLTVTPQSG